MGQTILVNFAGAEDLGLNQQLLSAQARQNASATIAGIDCTIQWDRQRLKQTSFYRENQDILDRPRGAGYWLWKPYIILEALKNADEDDVVVYWDVGRVAANTFQRPVEPLAQWCRQHRGMLPGVPVTRQGAWTKRDCFHYMQCDSARFWNLMQIQATFSLWSGRGAAEFVSEWLRWCMDRKCITDDPNECGLPNLPHFKDHRHDQSILTNLCAKQEVPALEPLSIPPGAWTKNINLWAEALADPPTSQELEAGPSNVRRLHEAGNVVRGELVCRMILARNAAQPDALHYLGTLCERTGRKREAEQILAGIPRIQLRPLPSQRPFVFISVPRNASSTVHYLLGLEGPKNFSRLSDSGILDNHATWRTILSRYGRDEFDRRFKFCFVRNPWDRAVSWYFHHLNSSPYKNMNFKEWIKAGMPHHWDVLNGAVYGKQCTPLEQFRFITDDDGKLVVDFVGRVERFEQDFTKVCDELGIQLPAKSVRVNAAKLRESADYRGYYDDETAEAVGKQLATDVRMFDYRFQDESQSNNR